MSSNPSAPARRALVTGASSGIGAAVVRRLRAEGWRVVAAARRADRLEALAAETGAEAYPLDITDDAAVAALAAHLEATGGLDAVVNNAGGALGQDRVEDGDVDGWRRMYELNVLGTLRVTQAVLPLLRASAEAAGPDGGSDVVVVTSTAAHGAYEGGAGYTAAKHAERMLSTTLRWEIAGEPVRVMEIAPGAVATEEFSLVRFDGDADRAAAVYEGYQPLLAEDVADAVAWTLTRPAHVNTDLMVIRPRAQAHNQKIARTGV
ncbi:MULTISPECIES: SDR family oxidoreductase [Isoptericola]|uniref:SDR family oxidoreductase n=1 Tax=Isoptericola sediminis TaxID=2733572 RepID=A0A849K2A3_9MICO|nr:MULTISPECIES: SDR family oxidoreductase [Isoptericola]MDO8144539.1 SDR family oxidoreductase [Isoptericola sp. 178]MDO8148383.1 SDR family oxidoreductase [Isoptericola sp. b515]MDO8151865.1 SDR family oxidoreductase [Isoptericola sp. b408]NNU27338.1 SDR family oxidoreductase [Isoptericola sediminis]